jgi:hypothetical protein
LIASRGWLLGSGSVLGELSGTTLGKDFLILASMVVAVMVGWVGLQLF